jgi:hypothetical protein
VDIDGVLGWWAAVEMITNVSNYTGPEVVIPTPYIGCWE